MSEWCWAVGAAGVAAGIGGVLLLRKRRLVPAATFALLGAAAVAVAALPEVRAFLPEWMAEEAPAPAATAAASTQPASYPAWFISSGGRTSRMPPNHPDPSAPRDGPHFTCHEKDAR